MPDKYAVQVEPHSSSQLPWYKELNAGHWQVLAASFMGWIFDGFENYALFLVGAPALRELLAPEQLPRIATYSGMVVASMLLGIGLGGISAGVVADYLGRKRTMMLTILVYSICTGLTGLVQSWPQLALMRFLAGVGMGGEWATGTTLVAESWPPRARAKGLGIMQSAFGWGALTASTIWYFLSANRHGPGTWRILFFLGIIPSVFVLYLRKNVKESAKWLEKRDERKELQAKAQRGHELTSEEKIVARFTLRALFGHPELRRRMLLCLVMSFGTTVGFWGVSTWIPAYVESIAKASHMVNPASWGAKVGILFTIGSIVGYVSSGFIADAVGRKAMLCVFFLGALITTPLVFVWTHSLGAVMAAACINGAFTLGQFAWMAVFSPELFPTSMRATAISLVFNAARIISTMGPFVAGYLITHLGGYSISALIFSSAYVLALCAVPFMPETKGQPLPV